MSGAASCSDHRAKVQIGVVRWAACATAGRQTATRHMRPYDRIQGRCFESFSPCDPASGGGRRWGCAGRARCSAWLAAARAVKRRRREVAKVFAGFAPLEDTLCDTPERCRSFRS